MTLITGVSAAVRTSTQEVLPPKRRDPGLGREPKGTMCVSRFLASLLAMRIVGIGPSRLP